MSNLLKRSITGIIIVVAITLGLLINSLVFFLVFFVIMTLVLWEFYHLMHMVKIRPQYKYGLAMASLMFVLNFFIAAGILDIHYLALLLALSVFIYINELFLQHNRPFHNIAYTFLGIIYIALPFSLFPFFVLSVSGKVAGPVPLEGSEDILNYLIQPSHLIHYSPFILLGIFILHWMYDTGAYLSGRWFGKRKLFRRISPKKTWEGVLGGSLLAIVTAVALSRFFDQAGVLTWITISLLIIFFGTLGDLTESMLKRKIGVKDSGKLLPGHGGFLDRFDGILLSIPVVFAWLQFMMR
ncbi:MAG: phosphatidate cytidylyltransferase [Chlorobi bacterium]|nr:phosphatidate cytidylyltransferase [Chlorobiota bacterium]